MKAAQFELAQPRTVGDAVRLLQQADGAGRVLAGGQSLVPMMNLRLAQPAILVDIGRIPELRTIDQAGDDLVIGSMVTHAAIEDGKVPDGAAARMLRFVAARIAYRGIRNRGTIGGSLSHADPSADWPAALLALGATVQTASPKGARRIAMAQFLVGAFTTALAADEIVTAIILPCFSQKARWAYNKVCRKIGEFPYSIGVVVDDPERNHCSVVLGAAGGRPVTLELLAQRLASHPASAQSIDNPAVLPEIASLGLSLDAIDSHIHATVLSCTIRRAYRQ